MTTGRLFVFSGAGLSADSGVPTFFGASGAYAGFDRPEELVSSRTMRERPEVIQRFCDDLRSGLARAAPNDAHLRLADLARQLGERFLHVTQNIDDMMERAGHEGTLHVHGYLPRMRSIGNTKVVEEIGHARYWDGDPTLAPERGFQFRCPKSNSRYRPDVVLFGEPAPLYGRLYKEIARLGEEDLAIVVGTRGEVVAIGDLLKRQPCRKVLVDPNPSEFIDERDFDILLRKGAAEAADDILDIALSHVTPLETGGGAGLIGAAAVDQSPLT